MKKVYYYPMPVGKIGIAQDGDSIVSVFAGEALPQGYEKEETPLIKKAAAQLSEYFDGKRRTFDLPFEDEGTPFEKRVWQALRDIPYGQTRSYGEIAASVGSPGASRAVGRANGRNPLLIITPCHRVIGADGSLTGFAAGVEMKKALLDIEKKNC